MNEFFTSNSAGYRLARTIIQGVIGVIIANLDLIVGLSPIPASVKPLIVAITMAILSPIMAAMGEPDQLGIDTYDEALDLDDEEVIGDE